MMLHRSTAQRAGPAGRSAPHVPQLCPTLSRPRSHSRSYKTTTVSALDPERSPTSPTVATSAAAGASLTQDGASTVPTPPSVSPSANALLAALSSMGASPWAKNVYGKPFTNSELNALQVTCSRRPVHKAPTTLLLGPAPPPPCPSLQIPFRPPGRFVVHFTCAFGTD